MSRARPAVFDAPVALILPHVAAALLALGCGVAALRARPGSRVHRRAGTAYVAGWGALALMGALMGHRHHDLSPFEVLNALGSATVALGYAPALFPRLRRGLAGADGRGWLRWHLRFMVGSMPFLVVAGINQTLPAFGVAYSMPLLAATTVVGGVVAGRASRALLRRHGLAAGAPRAASA